MQGQSGASQSGATTAGGHLHVKQGEGSELGSAKLTLLPTDPMERVIALFPLLPGAYLTPTCVARICRLVEEAHAPQGSETRAHAEACLKELDELEGTIERCLGEEGFLWEGAGVRGRDILQALSDGAMLQPALSVTPRRRASALGFDAPAHNRGRNHSSQGSVGVGASAPPQQGQPPQRT